MQRTTEAIRIDNKVKARYTKLVKDGYYLKPCVYDNVTIYEIVKDIHHPALIPSRSIYAEVSQTTGQQLKHLFSFHVKSITKYFGKAEPIEVGYKRTFHYN